MRMIINRLLLRFNLQLVNPTEQIAVCSVPKLQEELEEANVNLRKTRRVIARLQAAVYYYRSRYREVKGLPKTRKTRESYFAPHVP